MDFPKTVQIGHYTWVLTHYENPTDDTAWGETDHEALTIRIKDTLPPLHYATTVLHEVMHAALANSGIMEHDEQHITTLSNRLVEIMRDNPELVQYLIDS